MTGDRGHHAVSPVAVEVRVSNRADVRRAETAARMIADASRDNDIAERDAHYLARRIAEGMAALALRGDSLVGFGYCCPWEGGRFVSHSGLVVCPTMRGQGLGRQLKMLLFEIARRRYPDAVLMSLTSSPRVRAWNLSLGFRPVPHEELTSDPGFWEGCRACRNFGQVQRSGRRCCCEALVLRPEWLSDRQQ